MKTKIIIFICMFICFACEKEDNPELELGMYTEIYPAYSPETEMTKIDFVSKDKLIIYKNDVGDEFEYEINNENNTITLTTIIMNAPNITRFYFRIINNTTFEITNLGLHTAESTLPNMIFEKL